MYILQDIVCCGLGCKFGKAAMDFKAILLQPPRDCANQVPEPGMGVLVDRGKRQGHTLKVYLSAGLKAVVFL